MPHAQDRAQGSAAPVLQFEKAEWPEGFVPPEPLPRWRRHLEAARFGALLLGGITALRAAGVILQIAEKPRPAFVALGAVILAALGGGAGGWVYGFLGEELQPLGRTGVSHQSGLTFAAYLTAIMDVVAFTNDPLVTGWWLVGINLVLVAWTVSIVRYARRVARRSRAAT